METLAGENHLAYLLIHNGIKRNIIQFIYLIYIIQNINSGFTTINRQTNIPFTLEDNALTPPNGCDN